MKQQYGGRRKSNHSVPDSNCVEVGRSPRGTIGVRDTKQDGLGPTLDFTVSEWRTFLSTIRSSTPRGRR